MRQFARLVEPKSYVVREQRLTLVPSGPDSPAVSPRALTSQADDSAVLSDAVLVCAVRGDPPDSAALDILVGRYWATLVGRCVLLTGSADSAADLAQETWFRLLRARHTLDPSGAFAAYLITIATNLWRDRNRSARRAGPLGERRLGSLDAALITDTGESLALADILPDPSTLDIEEQAQLKIDVDRALGQLSPQARDVLIARCLDGESAAEIGRRYGRTEQTITSWVRQAMREMQVHLGAPSGGAGSAQQR
jgi:RNA polymerase sigma factor (sigma-70 family)